MKLFVTFVLLLSLFSIRAQTGIGTISPNSSAKLDVFSDNKGFLPPRVSLTNVYDQSTIPSPATGLLVYCKGDAGLAAGYYFWNGSAWATIATAGGSGSVAASFLRGSRTTTQSIAVGGIIIFTSLDNSSGPNISLNTATGKMTLAAGSTYRIRGAVPNYSGGQRPAFMWYNETASAYMGNGTYSYNPGDGASLGAFGTTAEVIISPNVSTDISFRLVSSLSSGSVIVGGNGDFNTTGSYPWCEVQVISGNAPMTLINFGDIKTGIQSGDHNGWVKLDGRLKSALSGTQQAQATSLGIGANLPDATNAFLVQNGSSLASVSGSNMRTLAQANLPNVNLTVTTVSAGDHTHNTGFTTSTMNLSWTVAGGGAAGYTIAGAPATTSNGAHTHTFTTNSINGGVTQTALDITPKSLSVNTFIYLGN